MYRGLWILYSLLIPENYNVISVIFAYVSEGGLGLYGGGAQGDTLTLKHELSRITTSYNHRVFGETSMKDNLLKLVEVQKIDAEIYKLNCKKLELPKEIESLKKEQEEMTETVTALKDKATRLEIDRKAKEVEVQSNADKAQKNDNQLSQIKKNDEYKTMLHQIKELKKKNDQLEEEILLIMEDFDIVRADLDKEETIFKAETDELKKKEQKIKTVIDNLELDIKNLQEGRIKYMGEVSLKIATVYMQVLDKRQDIALAVVREDFCSACHMVLLPEVIDQALLGRDIVQCDTCSRILYHSDLLAQLKTSGMEII